MRKVAVFPVSLTLAIVACIPLSGEAQDESAPRLFRPTSGAVVRVGMIEIAAIVPDTASSVTFALDGKPIRAAELPLPSEGGSSPPPTSATLGLQVDFNQLSAGGLIRPIRLAVRLVEPGQHEIILGKERIRFV
ncbi:hypothetical protein FJY63_14490, partial [Candidatus Sumerlaeota bacterium]|nr:hypothetical protein [Candidatus Sumerlaeota bacterium]